jgi:hypothetical protein
MLYEYLLMKLNLINANVPIIFMKSNDIELFNERK